MRWVLQQWLVPVTQVNGVLWRDCGVWRCACRVRTACFLKVSAGLCLSSLISRGDSESDSHICTSSHPWCLTYDYRWVCYLCQILGTHNRQCLSPCLFLLGYCVLMESSLLPYRMFTLLSSHCWVRYSTVCLVLTKIGRNVWHLSKHLTFFVMFRCRIWFHSLSLAYICY